MCLHHEINSIYSRVGINIDAFFRVSVVFLGKEEKWAQVACRDLRVFLVHQVQMDQRY